MTSSKDHTEETPTTPTAMGTRIDSPGNESGKSNGSTRSAGQKGKFWSSITSSVKKGMGKTSPSSSQRSASPIQQYATTDIRQHLDIFGQGGVAFVKTMIDAVNDTPSSIVRSSLTREDGRLLVSFKLRPEFHPYFSADELSSAPAINNQINVVAHHQSPPVGNQSPAPADTQSATSGDSEVTSRPLQAEEASGESDSYTTAYAPVGDRTLVDLAVPTEDQGEDEDATQWGNDTAAAINSLGDDASSSIAPGTPFFDATGHQGMSLMGASPMPPTPNDLTTVEADGDEETLAVSVNFDTPSRATAAPQVVITSPTTNTNEALSAPVDDMLAIPVNLHTPSRPAGTPEAMMTSPMTNANETLTVPIGHNTSSGAKTGDAPGTNEGDTTWQNDTAALFDGFEETPTEIVLDPNHENTPRYHREWAPPSSSPAPAVGTSEGETTWQNDTAALLGSLEDTPTEIVLDPNHENTPRYHRKWAPPPSPQVPLIATTGSAVNDDASTVYAGDATMAVSFHLDEPTTIVATNASVDRSTSQLQGSPVRTQPLQVNAPVEGSPARLGSEPINPSAAAANTGTLNDAVPSPATPAHPIREAIAARTTARLLSSPEFDENEIMISTPKNVGTKIGAPGPDGSVELNSIENAATYGAPGPENPVELNSRQNVSTCRAPDAQQPAETSVELKNDTKPESVGARTPNSSSISSFTVVSHTRKKKSQSPTQTGNNGKPQFRTDMFGGEEHEEAAISSDEENRQHLRQFLSRHKAMGGKPRSPPARSGATSTGSPKPRKALGPVDVNTVSPVKKATRKRKAEEEVEAAAEERPAKRGRKEAAETEAPAPTRRSSRVRNQRAAAADKDTSRIPRRVGTPTKSGPATSAASGFAALTRANTTANRGDAVHAAEFLANRAKDPAAARMADLKEVAAAKAARGDGPKAAAKTVGWDSRLVRFEGEESDERKEEKREEGEEEPPKKGRKKPAAAKAKGGKKAPASALTKPAGVAKKKAPAKPATPAPKRVLRSALKK